MYEYFSFRVRKFVYINGKYFSKLEDVTPEVTVMEFGLENTGCQQLISTKIELVRADALIVL
jgi:hypothetical protein